MSTEDDFTRRVERVASRMGIDAKCRRMHRTWSGEYGDEYFEPYDEYEIRTDRAVHTIDEELSRWNPVYVDSLITLELRAAFDVPRRGRA